MIQTLLSIILTSVLSLLLLALYIKRTLPNILEDVAISAGESITGHLKETFESPNLKRAMSILGKKSGEVRASDALRTKAAEGILESYPSIGFILDQLNLTPIEGLQLMNDPLIGPMIKGALEKGIKKFGQNFGMGRNNSEGIM